MGPSQAHGPFLKPMGPLVGPIKSMGPEVIAPSGPPLGGHDHAFTDVSRKRDVSLQNRYRYRYFVGDYDLKQ